MSNSYTTADFEAKLAEMEKRLQNQDRKIRQLASVATIGFLALQKHPFQDLFEAPEFEDFFDFIYEDFGACTNRCLAEYKSSIAACRGDKQCEADVVFGQVICMLSCDR